jgi:hypothetical protein
MRGSALSGRAITIGLLVLLASSGSLVADWLVTRDGQRVETKGAWKIKGKMVVFTLPNGTFSSLRLDSVDLDASREAEEQKEAALRAEAEPEIEKEPAKPILELTDADLPRRRRVRAEDPVDALEPEEDSPAPKPEGPSITVSSWQKVDRVGGGFEVVGAYRNGSSKMASDIKLTVLLYGDDGTVVDAVAANLTSASLGPDEQGQFTALFDAPRDFQSMKFDLSSFDIERND